MGCIRDAFAYIFDFGMPDHIIDHLDKIGEGILVDEVEFYENAVDWCCVMITEDRLRVPLKVPKDCPPELLTDELRNMLVSGILDAFNTQRRRKKAIEQFNQPEPEVPQARRLN